MKVPVVGLKAVHRAGAAAMHEFLVVMQVEAVEVDALAAFDLLDAQDLALQQLDRLAGAGLQDQFGKDGARRHRALPGAASALCAAAYSRKASRTSETRSGAVPCAMVRSISSSCCWFSRSFITVSAITFPLRFLLAAIRLAKSCIRDSSPDSGFLALRFASKRWRLSGRPGLFPVLAIIRSAKFGRLGAPYSSASTKITALGVRDRRLSYAPCRRTYRRSAQRESG